MKHRKVLLWPAAAILAFAGMSHIVTSSGSPGGRTGSPGDGSLTCTSCHGGGKATDKPGWITSNIPETGYRPGEEYEVTLKGEHAGGSTFGFELTAEKSGNVKTGGFDRGGNSQIKLLSTDKSVTHTSGGIAGSGGQKSWTAKWKAPASGTGPVTFYAAVNAANGDGGTGGDVIYATRLTVAEADLSSVNPGEVLAGIRVFPNPASVNLTVELEGLPGQDVDLALYNLQGKMVENKKFPPALEKRLFSLPVADLPIGTYLVVVTSGYEVVRSKVLIHR